MKTLESILKLVVVAITLMLVSCEEKIDLAVHSPDTKILVVEGMITSEATAHVVNLSYSGGFYLDKETARATGARVVISDDKGNEFPLHEVSAGKYVTDTNVAGTVGTTYTLMIEYKDQIYQGLSTMQRVPEIDSLALRWDKFKQDHRILLYGQEPQGKGDNYLWHIYKNSQLVTDAINKVLLVNDEFIDGNYIKGFEVDYWEVDFNFQPGDTVTVVQHSISSKAFDFFVGILSEYNNGQAAMRPPANVPSNISNGALGLFHASAISTQTIIIE